MNVQFPKIPFLAAVVAIAGAGAMLSWGGFALIDSAGLAAPGQTRYVGALLIFCAIIISALATRRMLRRPEQPPSPEPVSPRPQDLEKQFHFLETLLETIPNPIFYKDASERRYLGCNSAFEAYLGIPKSQLIGRSVYDISPPELAKVYDRADLELLNSEGVQVYEADVRYADGTLHNVIFNKSVFHNRDGTPGGLIGIIVDITARKQAENDLLSSREELRKALAATEEAHARLGDILRSVVDGLIVCDNRRQVVLVNPIAERLLSLPGEELLGRPLLELPVAPELLATFRSALEELAETGNAQACEVCLPIEKRQRVLQLRPSVRKDQDGSISGAIFLMRDITHEHELDRMKSEFISTAAHELRTPLTAIVGFAELLQIALREGSFSAEERDDFLREILDKCERLERIIEDFLDISRIEAGRKLHLNKTRCDLVNLTERVVHHFVYHSSQHRFVIEPGSPGPEPLQLDASRMIQVLENLLSNAVKYSPHGGTIRIDFEHHGADLLMTIRDEGIGMTPEQVERVFDKFYRADSSNTAIGGLGLGMSLVRAIIVEHGGEVWVESRPQAGTTVYVKLPRQDAAADAEEFVPAAV